MMLLMLMMRMRRMRPMRLKMPMPPWCRRTALEVVATKTDAPAATQKATGAIRRTDVRVLARELGAVVMCLHLHRHPLEVVATKLDAPVATLRAIGAIRRTGVKVLARELGVVLMLMMLVRLMMRMRLMRLMRLKMPMPPWCRRTALEVVATKTDAPAATQKATGAIRRTGVRVLARELGAVVTCLHLHRHPLEVVATKL